MKGRQQKKENFIITVLSTEEDINKSKNINRRFQANQTNRPTNVAVVALRIVVASSWILVCGCNDVDSFEGACSFVTCSGYGQCVENEDEATCLCDDGYVANGLECVYDDHSGIDSDPNPCTGVTCSGYGVCVVSDGIATCECDDGYEASGLECVETSPPYDGPLPIIPEPNGDCPILETGMIYVMDMDVQLWVGEPRDDVQGMVFFYWHATGNQPSEAEWALGPAIDEIVEGGGIVASFTGRDWFPSILTTPFIPGNTGNGVWFVQDMEVADHILSCAVEQLNIDTRRIYAGGNSAGGLQAGTMAVNRSSYLASVMTISGGIVELLVALGWLEIDWSHPTHVPAVISNHGDFWADWVGVHFELTTEYMNNMVREAGGFVVNCDHGAGHSQPPDDMLRAQWQFLKDHPFGTNPSPYAEGLPPGFHDMCYIYQ